MSHKQTSLFDFDEPSPQKDEIKLLPVEEEDELSLLKDDPVKTNLVYDIEITAETVLPKQPKRGRRKITEVYVTADLIDVPEDEVLFQKNITVSEKLLKCLK